MTGNADPSPQQITYLNFIWKGILLLLLMTSQWQPEPNFQFFFVKTDNVDIGDLFGKV